MNSQEQKTPEPPFGIQSPQESPFLPTRSIQSPPPLTPQKQHIVELLSMNPLERMVYLEQMKYHANMTAANGSSQADEKIALLHERSQQNYENQQQSIREDRMAIQANVQIRQKMTDAALDNVANIDRLLMSLQAGDDGDQEPAADGTEGVAGVVGGGVGGFPARVNRQQMPERNAAPMQQAQVDELKEMLFSQQQSDVRGSYHRRQNSAQQLQIDELKAEIDELKRQNGALQQRVDSLERQQAQTASLQTQIDELKRRQAAQQE